MDKESTADPTTPFKKLQFRVADVHWRWKNWKQLFMCDPARSEETDDRFTLMDSVSPHFFILLKDVLLQDVALRLCKLIDPAESGPPKARRRNFSLLAALEDAKARPEFLNPSQVQALVSKMKSSSTPLIQWRNWIFAHDDYEVATGAHEPSPLTDEHIESALRSAIEVMNLIDPQYGEVGFAYSEMIALGDADSLIQALRNAKKYEIEQIRRYLK